MKLHSRKIAALVRCWEGMGHEVELICGGDLLPDKRKKSVDKNMANKGSPPWYRRLGFLQPFVNTVSEWANIKHDRRLAAYVGERIHKFKPDVYMQRSSRIDGRTLNVAIQSGVPVVLEWKDNMVVSRGARKSIGRGDLYGFGFLKPYARWVESWKESIVPVMIVESEVLKNRLSRNLNRSLDSFIVAHNAVNVEDFLVVVEDRKAIRDQLGLPQDKFLATFVGSFNWYQNVEYLIQAIAHPGCPTNVEAVLVGDGEHRKSCEKTAIELKVMDRVHFIGQVPHDQVPLFLGASDAAVLPDCTDIITPIKVQEYMAMGLASVVPDYAANREVLSDGETGILFEPKNIPDLVKQLVRIERDVELRKAIGKSARLAVSERFSWEATWGRAIEFVSNS